MTRRVRSRASPRARTSTRAVRSSRRADAMVEQVVPGQSRARCENAGLKGLDAYGVAHLLTSGGRVSVSSPSVGPGRVQPSAPGLLLQDEGALPWRNAAHQSCHSSIGRAHNLQGPPQGMLDTMPHEHAKKARRKREQTQPPHIANRRFSSSGPSFA